MKENWRLRSQTYQPYRNLGVSPVLAKVLSGRVEREQADAFLHPEGDWTDPSRMQGIDRAVPIILRHIENHDRIDVCGDYDVDGLTAATILVRAFEQLGAHVFFHVPNRVEDGYGLGVPMVREIAEAGAKLIVTCDNGISQVDAVAEAKRLGLDVIVTDHHDIPKTLPQADILIDPKLPTDDYPFKGLCGAGVALQLSRALLQSQGQALPTELIGYAALGTVCDVMELRDDNRKIVYQGLAAWNANPPLFIRDLMQVSGLNRLSVYAFGFVLGPMLNSGGRLEDQMPFLKMMIHPEPAESLACATHLFHLNRERQRLTEDGLKEAVRQATARVEDRVEVIYLPDLHESVAGLVAGKLKEKLYRPTFVVTGHGLCKGSGRSIPAYSMYESMQKAGELFDRFGGHPMAAGFSIAEKNIETLRAVLNDQCELKDEDFVPNVFIDMEMPLYYANDTLCRELRVLEPYGTGNPKPLFAQRSVSLRRLHWLGQSHKAVRLTLDSEHRRYETVCFRIEELEATITEGFGPDVWAYLARESELKQPLSVDVVYQVDENEFRGVTKTELVITNIRCSQAKK